MVVASFAAAAVSTKHSVETAVVVVADHNRLVAAGNAVDFVDSSDTVDWAADKIVVVVVVAVVGTAAAAVDHNPYPAAASFAVVVDVAVAVAVAAFGSAHPRCPSHSPHQSLPMDQLHLVVATAEVHPFAAAVAAVAVDNNYQTVDPVHYSILAVVVVVAVVVVDHIHNSAASVVVVLHSAAAVVVVVERDHFASHMTMHTTDHAGNVVSGIAVVAIHATLHLRLLLLLLLLHPVAVAAADIVVADIAVVVVVHYSSTCFSYQNQQTIHRRFFYHHFFVYSSLVSFDVDPPPSVSAVSAVYRSCAISSSSACPLPL
mmetsp:Transcript_50136/g.83502  ORF Transcript_50136/g.83502 Transcript_50136/m.83502 type:complete len:316 (+) Transcript_50136:365-1312(+)